MRLYYLIIHIAKPWLVSPPVLLEEDKHHPKHPYRELCLRSSVTALNQHWLLGPGSCLTDPDQAHPQALKLSHPLTKQTVLIICGNNAPSHFFTAAFTFAIIFPPVWHPDPCQGCDTPATVPRLLSMRQRHARLHMDSLCFPTRVVLWDYGSASKDHSA